MTRQEKLDHLRSLAEDVLRAQVLVPLLVKLGFHDPLVHHHSGEKGKDIICKDLDEKLGKIRYIALVVKAGDLDGSAGGPKSYFTLINQIKQALNEPCKDVYETREIRIDQVMIVVSGRILPTALESVHGTLQADRLDRAIRDTLDGERLVTLLDEKFPDYWIEVERPTETLLRERNVLLNNLGKLLTVLVPDAQQRERALAQLGTRELEVSLFPFRDMAPYMIDFGYGRISIDHLDHPFDEPFLNTEYEDIRKQISNFRKRVQHILYDISDGIEPIVELLRTTDASKLAKLCKAADKHTAAYSRMSFDVSDLSLAEDLIHAIAQYQQRDAALNAANCRSLYFVIMRELHVKVTMALIEFFATYGKEAQDHWIGFKASFSLPDTRGESSVYSFQAEPRLLRDEGNFKDYESSRVHRESADELCVEFAPRCYAWWDESKLTVEELASQFVKHFEHAFAERFFADLAEHQPPTGR